MCVHMYPSSMSWGSCPIFHLWSEPELRKDGQSHGLTVMALVKQFSTGWEEDVRELRDLPDHVHCSQNSLQVSGGSERPRGLPGWISPLPQPLQPGVSFCRGKCLESCHLTFLRTYGLGSRRSFSTSVARSRHISAEPIVLRVHRAKPCTACIPWLRSLQSFGRMVSQASEKSSPSSTYSRQPPGISQFPTLPSP